MKIDTFERLCVDLIYCVDSDSGQNPILKIPEILMIQKRIPQKNLFYNKIRVTVVLSFLFLHLQYANCACTSTPDRRLLLIWCPGFYEETVVLLRTGCPQMSTR
jgi:hypothetical protein